MWAKEVERVRVNFITESFEANIQLDGVQLLKPDGTPYTTPCTVPNLPARSHQIVFRRPPLPDLNVGQVDFRDSRDVEARWDSKSAPDTAESTSHE
jgi:hypothetical protein